MGFEHVNPYDDVPYRSRPVGWAAPERLALTSLLHGGPRCSLRSYRFLELGCGDASNLLPLAFYRPHATFIGIDAAGSAIALGRERCAALKLDNLELVHADFREALEILTGSFDFIIAHGVFSWIPNEARDALFRLTRNKLRPGGLFYFNYNTKPGWNVRGMVRDFLLAQTEGVASLRERASRAVALGKRAGEGLKSDHPYGRLLAQELAFVGASDLSYVAHEFLAAENTSFWRSELLSAASAKGFAYVADADFNQATGRVPPDLPGQMVAEGLVELSSPDAIDLFTYRQMHAPIFTTSPWQRVEADGDELANLILASPLVPLPQAEARSFAHFNGATVDVRSEPIASALERLLPLWPSGRPLGEILRDPSGAFSDLRLLHTHGLLELRLVDQGRLAPAAEPLHALEGDWHGQLTTAYHDCMDASLRVTGHAEVEG